MSLPHIPHLAFRDRTEFAATTPTGERIIYRILPNGELLCAACCLLLTAADWDYQATTAGRHHDPHTAARAEHQADLARAEILDHHPWGCTCDHAITPETAWEAVLYDPPPRTPTTPTPDLEPGETERCSRWQALTIAAGIAAGIAEVQIVTLCAWLPTATAWMLALLTSGTAAILLYRHLANTLT